MCGKTDNKHRRILLITHVCCGKTLAGIQLSVIDEIITDGFRSFICVRCDLLSLRNIYALCVQNNIFCVNSVLCWAHEIYGSHPWASNVRVRVVLARASFYAKFPLIDGVL